MIEFIKKAVKITAASVAAIMMIAIVF